MPKGRATITGRPRRSYNACQRVRHRRDGVPCGNRPPSATAPLPGRRQRPRRDPPRTASDGVGRGVFHRGREPASATPPAREMADASRRCGPEPDFAWRRKSMPQRWIRSGGRLFSREPPGRSVPRVCDVGRVPCGRNARRRGFRGSAGTVVGWKVMTTRPPRRMIVSSRSTASGSQQERPFLRVLAEVEAGERLFAVVVVGGPQGFGAQRG